MFKLEYSSNNSGGSWWLKDKDWKALEDAGWVVEWYAEEKQFNGKPYPDGRFIGALASRAHKFVESKTAATEAVEEWESVTGQNATSQGCNCCGRPHYFSLNKEVPCTHCDKYDNKSECGYCDGTRVYDEYVSSFDVEPRVVEYRRAWD